MAKIYAWPPVGVLASKWTRRSPIVRSRSLITGARYASAMRRERIAASFRVGGWSFDYTGHGYMEALKRFLAGGENYVRLYEVVEPYMDSPRLGAWTGAMEWRGPTNQVVTWRTGSGATLAWTAGQLYPAVVQSGSPRYVRVTGLPPNRVVIRPSNRILLIVGIDSPPISVFSTQRVMSNRDGEANIRVNTEPGTDITHAVLRPAETGIFEIDGAIPEVSSAVNEEPVWEWNFLQVFQDEIDGTPVEEDPW